MKIQEVYRYNCEKRTDRNFNKGLKYGEDKNPNALKFYAKNMEYAENYRFIFSKDGYLMQECTLEVASVDVSGLFNMAENFETLQTYKNYIDGEISVQLRDYNKFLSESKTKKDKMFWAAQIEGIFPRSKSELDYQLIHCEFEFLSNYGRQNELVAELKSLGFRGYETKNEIAIF